MNKKVSDRLKTASKNFEKAQKIASAQVRNLGYQSEITSKLAEAWIDLESKPKLPQPFAGSADVFSREILTKSESIGSFWDSTLIDTSMLTASTASEALYGTTISGVSVYYPPHLYPPQISQIGEIVAEQEHKDEVARKLRTIDESLEETYQSAWSSYYSGIRDKTRGPLFLMREVVRRVIDHFAPDDDTRMSQGLAQTQSVTRKDKVAHLISITPTHLRNDMQSQEKELTKIYDLLSSAHKPGELDLEKTKGYLYQSNALLRLILNIFA